MFCLPEVAAAHASTVARLCAHILISNLHNLQRIDSSASHSSIEDRPLLDAQLPQGAAFLLDSLPKLLAELEVRHPSVPTPGLAEIQDGVTLR
jgi:hypothetical protein